MPALISGSEAVDISGIEAASLRRARAAGRAAPVLARGLLYLRGPEFVVCLEAIPQK